METIIGRLQTPADEDGLRRDIHLLTDGDAVTINTSDGRNITLNDRLDEIGGGTVISREQPQRACIWYQVKSTDPVDEG